MKYLTFFTVLLLTPLASLHAAAAEDSVLLDQSAFGTASRQLPPNNYGLGANSTGSPIVPLSHAWTFTTKPELKSGAKGLPSAYQLGAKVGQLIVVPEAANFRMNMAVANLKKSSIDLRWRDETLCYRLDLVEGTLTKIADGKTTLLAQAKIPLLTGEKETWPPRPLNWGALEIIARNGTIQVRVSADGKTWEDAIQCEDAAPIPSGAIVLGAGQFGDLRVEALPATFQSRRLAAQGPEYNEALMTSMERLGLKAVIAQMAAIEYLSNLATPVPPEVSTALAVAQSNEDLSIRLAALRTIHALKLNLDVPSLLLDGLSSDKSLVRFSSASGLVNLRLPPDQIQAKVVDALMKGNQFARHDVKMLIFEAGEPLQAAVFQEIKSRYSKASDPGVKVALLKALGRDSLKSRWVTENPRAETLPLLAKALSDSSAEVRLAAMQTLHWLESPVAWSNAKTPNLFRDNSEPTAQIVKALQAILQADASVACRAEAAGCLAEMRQAPETVIAALGDKDASVRTSVAQGLVCFDRSQLQDAIPALQKLTADADYKTDAEGALGYIQNQEASAAIAANGKEALPSLNKLRPEELVAGTARRVDEAARVSLAMQAERLPFPNDFLAHSSAQLSLKRNRQGANARLRQCLHHYNFRDNESLDGTKLPLVYALHYSKSRYFPGGLTPETEGMIKEAMFSYVDWKSKADLDDFVKDVTKTPGTENQSLQFHYGLWYMDLALLNEDPAYASRMLRGGKTVAQYYTEWNAYMKKWLRTRALNGLWIELGSGYCWHYSVPAVLGVYAAATDPETRQLTKMFLDLAMIEETQAGFGDVRGGNNNRNKGNGIVSPGKTVFSFLYEGRKMAGGKGSHQLAASGYRAPAVAILLRAFEQYPPKPIVIANRRFGEVRYLGAPGSSESEAETAAQPEAAKADTKASAETDADDNTVVDTRPRYVADSKTVSYLWKTRHYMLGSMLRDPKTVMGSLYKNCPWNGVLFADGKGLFPDCYSPYFSFQHKNVFILQPGDHAKPPMNIMISPGLEQFEENGWVFIKDSDAYVGIKILKGGYKWEKDKGAKKWLSLVSEVPASPILIEGGDKDEYGSFDDFKATLQKNTITLGADKVEYSGPKQPRIEFFFESTGQASKVDGKPFSPDSEFVYSSPYMQRKQGESIVTVTVSGKRVIYDFDKATITETNNPK